MPIKLPQEVRTPKLNSLDGELKNIAEELIAKKFDIKEEVVEQFAPNPFQRDVYETIQRHDGTVFHANDTYFGNGRGRFRRDIKVQIQPWDRSRVATLEIGYPSERNVVEAMRHLDYENLRGEKKLYATPGWFRELMQDDRMMRAFIQHRRADSWRDGIEESIGELYGMRVVIHKNLQYSFIETKF